MSFNVGLSGLRAATSDLNVTGNNIANAGTAGFKQSRAEFADLYASSMLSSGSNPIGTGALLSNVSQQFSQGNLNYTQNSLDLAIQGNGFFVTSNNGDVNYTRAGYFGTDREGFIVNNFGHKLQGYMMDDNGNQLALGDLKVEKANQSPKATTNITQPFNLDSTSTVPTTTVFNPADPSSYNKSTPVNIYDSQGNAHSMTQYYVKTGPNNWNVHVLIDGRNPTDPTSTTALTTPLVFRPDGTLQTPADGAISIAGWIPAAPNNAVPPVWASNGSAASTPIKFDFRGSTQFNSVFSVNSLSQDGYTTGELAGLDVDESGRIFARYTNDQTKVLGQVVLANFANMQGLTPVGKTAWAQSYASGEPVLGTPSSGTLGALQSGALEDSNVELSDQLVNLIVAQRNYQANAKTIETESTITQTIINLR